MSEAKLLIDASELESKENRETVEALAKFLEEKTGGTAELMNGEIRLENVTVRKSYLRTLVRKFLHKEKLREYFRVLAEAEKLIVKEKKTTVSE